MLIHLYYAESVAAERREELERSATRSTVPVEPEPTRRAEPEVRIRLATCSDVTALAQLAALAERPIPTNEDVLVAEVDGELRAALRVSGGEPVGDPFYATADLVSLLSLRAAQLAPRRTRRGAWRRALRPAL